MANKSLKTLYEPGSFSAMIQDRALYKALPTQYATQAREIELTEIEIGVVVRGERLTNLSYNLILAYYLSRFYPEHGLCSPNPSHLAACVAGLLLNCSDFTPTTQWLEGVKAFETAGVRLKITPMTWNTFRTRFLRHIEDKFIDEDLQEFSNIFPEFGYLMKDTRAMCVLACITILACYKSLSADNHEKWIDNRVQTFIGSLPDPQSRPHLTSNTYPKLQNLTLVENFVSGNHSVKRELFMMIGAIAKGNRQTFITNGMSDIMTFLSGHNLGPITMIDKYIFQQHPEFLKLSILRGFKQTFTKALSYLHSLKPEEAAYVKILKDKEETSILNRKNFDLAHTLALVVARRQTASFDNYKITSTPVHEALEAFANEYLTIRESQMSLSAGTHDAKHMTEIELAEFEKIAITLMHQKFKRLEEMTEDDNSEDLDNYLKLG